LVIPADWLLSAVGAALLVSFLPEGTRGREQGQGPYRYCSSAAMVREVAPFRSQPVERGGDGEQAAG
jgi:hypothetical protein